MIPLDTHSKANLLPLVISKKFKTFSKNPFTFNKKPKILNVLRNLTISVACYSKFATLSDFKKQRFFSKNPSIFFKTQILKVFTILVAFYGKFATI